MSEPIWRGRRGVRRRRCSSARINRPARRAVESTERLRLGSLVFGTTYRHPAVLANWAATFDHLSGGRFVLGLRAGPQPNEHDQSRSGTAGDCPKRSLHAWLCSTPRANDSVGTPPRSPVPPRRWSWSPMIPLADHVSWRRSHPARRSPGRRRGLHRYNRPRGSQYR